MLSYIGDTGAAGDVPVLENFRLVTLGALLLLGITVLLLAKMLTAAENRPLRFAFGRASRLLLGVFALEYLVALILAVSAARATARIEEKLAKRFGCPMTAEGLAAYYARFGTPDREFWTKMTESRRRLPAALPCGIPWDSELPDRPEPERTQSAPVPQTAPKKRGISLLWLIPVFVLLFQKIENITMIYQQMRITIGFLYRWKQFFHCI